MAFENHPRKAAPTERSSEQRRVEDRPLLRDLLEEGTGWLFLFLLIAGTPAIAIIFGRRPIVAAAVLCAYWVLVGLAWLVGSRRLWKW